MGDANDANRKLQERLARPPESWVDIVMVALIGDPAFYGVLACITVCILAVIALLAAKVLLDQIEEDEAKEQKRKEREQEGGEAQERGSKKEQ